MLFSPVFNTIPNRNSSVVKNTIWNSSTVNYIVMKTAQIFLVAKFAYLNYKIISTSWNIWHKTQPRLEASTEQSLVIRQLHLSVLDSSINAYLKKKKRNNIHHLICLTSKYISAACNSSLESPFALSSFTFVPYENSAFQDQP